MKPIKEYLPKKDVVIVQGRVSKELAHEIKAVLKKQNINWNEFLTACFLRYRDEMKGERK